MTNVRETISQLLYLDVCPQPASWRDANQKEAYQQMTTFSLTGRDDLIIFDLKTSQEKAVPIVSLKWVTKGYKEHCRMKHSIVPDFLMPLWVSLNVHVHKKGQFSWQRGPLLKMRNAANSFTM